MVQDPEEDEKVGQGSTSAEDRQTAAEVLGTGGGEFRDPSGSPEPLYVAGKLSKNRHVAL